MVDREQTVGEAGFTSESHEVYSGNMRQDIIRSWNDRRLSNNIDITSLTPFVQLIGIFNQAEYEKMFSTKNASTRQPVVFTPDSIPAGGSSRVADYVPPDAPEKTAVGAPSKSDSKDVWEKLESKLKDRFINLYLYEGITVEEAEKTRLQITPQNGILMARAHGGSGEKQEMHSSQANDATGGVGITSLDVDYGKTNTLGSRKFNLRLTVNNPSIIDDQPEFAQLSTLQGEFIIIYGWSNPGIIQGYRYGSPPTLEYPGDTNRPTMHIPLDGINNGGMWNASKVNIFSYDFSFNEMGQLEINVGFMDKSSLHFNSTRISSIADVFRKLFSSADYDPTSSTGKPPRDFTDIDLVLDDGTVMPLAQLAEGSVASDKPGSFPTGRSPTDLAGSFISQNQSIVDALAEHDDKRGSWASVQGEFNDQEYWKEVREREGSAFPYAGPGVRSYQTDTVDVVVGTDDDGTPETEPRTVTKVKMISYYLGWVLEGMRISLNSQNRSSLREGETPFLPKFKYLANDPNSHLRTASQDRIRNIEDRSSYELQIQNALTRWHENLHPPLKRLGWNANYANIKPAASQAKQALDETNLKYFNLDFSDDALDFSSQREYFRSQLSLKKKTVTAQNGIGVAIEGDSTTKNLYKFAEIAERIFPTPKTVRDGFKAYRGQLITVNLLEKDDSDNYKWQSLLSDTKHTDGKGDLWRAIVGASSETYIVPDDDGDYEVDVYADKLLAAQHMVLKIFKPDWYVQVGPDGTAEGGSPDGFDPSHRTRYKAKQRNGRFYVGVNYTFEHNNGDDDDLRTSTNEVLKLYHANEWMTATEESWKLTQEEWHNAYIGYLGDELNRLIRKRIGEIEKAGLPLESIYAEPVDLDYITSVVYRNYTLQTAAVNSGVVKPWDTAKVGITDEVNATWQRLQNNNVDNTHEIEAARQSLTTNVRTIREAVNELQPQQERIEELTGGRYERNVHGAGFNYLIDFKNWEDTVRGDRNDGQPKALPDGSFIFEPLDRRSETVGIPRITLEWIIWRDFKIPTNNFQATPGVDEPGDSQIKLFNQQPFYRHNAESQLSRDERELEEILTSIEPLIKKRNDAMSKWWELTENIEYYEERQEQLTVDISNQSRFGDFAQQTQAELSIYDPSDASDGVQEVYMGRENIMRLEGVVAQQWFRKLSGIHMYGCLDVNHYIPKRGGTPFYRPSHEKDFRYFPERQNLPVVNSKGIKQVVDPSFAVGQTADNQIPNIQFSRTQTIGQYLNRAFNSDPDALKAAHQAGRGYGWEIFGEPEFEAHGANLPDDSPMKSKVNEWGYVQGTIRIENGYNVGGSHVGNYREFLALVGLEADNPQTTIVGTSKTIILDEDLIEEEAYKAAETHDFGDGSGSQRYIRWRGCWPGCWGYIQKNSGGQAYGVYHTMMDDHGNVIAYDAAYASGTGRWVMTGWVLTDGGDPVYIYPSAENAVKIDPKTQKIEYKGNKDSKNANGTHGQVGDRSLDGTDRDGGQRAHYDGDPASWAHRLGNNEHNPNLTIEEKRALIVHENDPGFAKSLNTKGHDTGGKFRKKGPGLWTLGVDVPFKAPTIGQRPGTRVIDWDKVGVPEAITDDDGKEVMRYSKGAYSPNKAAANAALIGPSKLQLKPYRNPEFPYGTGWYGQSGWRGAANSSGNKIYGSSQHIKDWSNYVPIGHLLKHFPNGGATNSINDENYSDSYLDPVNLDSAENPIIINPGGINRGFFKFIIQNVYAPFPRNRRFAASDISGNNGHPTSGWSSNRDNNGRRMKDLTYGMLFKPKPGEEEEDDGGVLKGIADIGVKAITNVADIPIRRTVVDNLMNRNNAKMSMAQFIQEIIHPSAMDINTGNIHVGLRQVSSDTFEVFQANKDWRGTARQIEDSEARNILEDRYPMDCFLIDYKAKDSLIQNIDMNSKFDPTLTINFERGAQAFAGNPEVIVKFLSYGQVAADLKSFLADEDKLRNPESPLYSKVITVPETDAGAAQIEIDRNAFFDDPANNHKKLISDSLMARFLGQQPERMRKLNVMIQSTDGANFASQLLSHYMRRCVVTIHGTTGLTPFNYIYIRGILPNLEGLYWVTGVRESVSPQDFKTIIDGVLLNPRQIDEPALPTDAPSQPVTPP